MSIGTAKPVGDELGGIKHHFVDFLSVKEPYSVGDYERDVDQFLKEYFKEKDVVFLIGGAGLFLDAVCKGLDEFPEPDLTIRRELNSQFSKDGIIPLLEKLKDVDVSYYETVDQSNHRRVIRALEVTLSSGKPFSSFLSHNNNKEKYPTIWLGLNQDRAILNDRINKRVDSMIENGLIEEVKTLVRYKDNQALKTVGYLEIFNYLEGKCTLEDAVQQIKHNTRKYSKRQLTWFRKNNSIQWFSAGNTEKIISFLETRIG